VTGRSCAAPPSYPLQQCVTRRSVGAAGFSLQAWGWIVPVGCALELLAAASVGNGDSFGCYPGIFVASIALINWLFRVPIQPGRALIAPAMAMMVICGLPVYGGQGFEH